MLAALIIVLMVVALVSVRLVVKAASTWPDPIWIAAAAFSCLIWLALGQIIHRRWVNESSGQKD
jgi:hypothetical protein